MSRSLGALWAAAAAISCWVFIYMYEKRLFPHPKCNNKRCRALASSSSADVVSHIKYSPLLEREKVCVGKFREMRQLAKGISWLAEYMFKQSPSRDSNFYARRLEFWSRHKFLFKYLSTQSVLISQDATGSRHANPIFKPISAKRFNKTLWKRRKLHAALSPQERRRELSEIGNKGEDEA